MAVDIRATETANRSGECYRQQMAFIRYALEAASGPLTDRGSRHVVRQRFGIELWGAYGLAAAIYLEYEGS
jgi:hypothetical protein